MSDRRAIARVVASVVVVVAAAVGGGCGDAAKERGGRASSSGSTGTPAVAGSAKNVAGTVAGVGPAFSGPSPIPNTPAACIQRWNASPNAKTRHNVVEATPTPGRALVRIARKGDYFGPAGRCVVWIASEQQPDTATVFMEREPSVFENVGGGSKLLVTPDLAVDPQGRIAA